MKYVATTPQLSLLKGGVFPLTVGSATSLLCGKVISKPD